MLPKYSPKFKRYFVLSLIGLFIISGLIVLFVVFRNYQNNLKNYQNQISELSSQKINLDKLLEETQVKLTALENEDPRKTNKELQTEIGNIQKTYKAALVSYNDLLDLRIRSKNTTSYDKLFAQILNQLSARNYSSASATLAELDKGIRAENEKLTASVSIPANVPENNTPPGSGYRRQRVSVNDTTYLVDIVSADLNSTKVVIDTASDSDCANNCPVKPLAEYVSRSGAFAGVNGSYFCPETYPDCANKKNSFDTLLMNKNKKYFNSDNNVYSTVPAAIFYGNTYRFVTQSLEWGRDTGVDAVIANHPLLLLNGQIMFSGGSVEKQNNKGNRSFVGATGNTVYLGVVHGVTVAESAVVLKTLGINNALNLDNGGSTAFWSGGYKVGPGRNLPNAVLLIKK